MPIRRSERSRYPRDWPRIRAAILERARHRCERCGVHNYAVGHRNEHGLFMPLCGPSDAARLAGQGLRFPSGTPISFAEAQHFMRAAPTGGKRYGPIRWFVIVLTVAHLNHVPEDCRPENLQALCQACHLRHDAAHHAANARRTRRDGRARDLFEEGST